MNQRVIIFIYGMLAYCLSMAALLCTAGFLIGIPESIGIDREPSSNFLMALLTNLSLVVLFSLQHSLMARPSFKEWLTRFIPPVAERSTYVLVSSILMFAVIFLWQPMGVTIWLVENPILKIILYTLYALGWAILVISTFLINHFDLFGLRQIFLNLKNEEYTYLKFQTPMFYKWVRHPIYVGWIAVFWFTPHMTLAHLVFAITFTAYIFIAIPYEERDLVTFHGEEYLKYCQSTAMIVPGLKSSQSAKE